MRLLNVNTFKFEDVTEGTKEYAIPSHKWLKKDKNDENDENDENDGNDEKNEKKEGGEKKFQDFQKIDKTELKHFTKTHDASLSKIVASCSVARQQKPKSLKYIWIDTICTIQSHHR